MHTDQPRLAWLGAKMAKQSNGGRKNAPGLRFEHLQAIPEDASRTLAIEVDKALKPTPAPETETVIVAV